MRSLLSHNKDLLLASLAEVGELDSRNHELQDLHRLQAEFMANLTHELRRQVHGQRSHRRAGRTRTRQGSRRRTCRGSSSASCRPARPGSAGLRGLGLTAAAWRPAPAPTATCPDRSWAGASRAE
jgi:hypothetical protein